MFGVYSNAINLRSPKINSPTLKRSWLSPGELKNAMIVWICLSQKMVFPSEYSKLSQNQIISNSSSLLNRYPYFNNVTGCIRLGSRLQNAILISTT